MACGGGDAGAESAGVGLGAEPGSKSEAQLLPRGRRLLPAAADPHPQSKNEVPLWRSDETLGQHVGQPPNTEDDEEAKDDDGEEEEEVGALEVSARLSVRVAPGSLLTPKSRTRRGIQLHAMHKVKLEQLRLKKEEQIKAEDELIKSFLKVKVGTNEELEETCKRHFEMAAVRALDLERRQEQAIAEELASLGPFNSPEFDPDALEALYDHAKQKRDRIENDRRLAIERELSYCEMHSVHGRPHPALSGEEVFERLYGYDKIYKLDIENQRKQQSQEQSKVRQSPSNRRESMRKSIPVASSKRLAETVRRLHGDAEYRQVRALKNEQLRLKDFDDLRARTTKSQGENDIRRWEALYKDMFRREENRLWKVGRAKQVSEEASAKSVHFEAQRKEWTREGITALFERLANPSPRALFVASPVSKPFHRRRQQKSSKQKDESRFCHSIFDMSAEQPIDQRTWRCSVQISINGPSLCWTKERQQEIRSYPNPTADWAGLFWTDLINRQDPTVSVESKTTDDHEAIESPKGQPSSPKVAVAGPIIAATVVTGFKETTGVYTYRGRSKNGCYKYEHPNGAVLQFEVNKQEKGVDERSGGKDANWAADSWIFDNCWTIHSGGRYHYAVKADADLGLLRGKHGWRSRENTICSIHLECTQAHGGGSLFISTGFPPTSGLYSENGNIRNGRMSYDGPNGALLQYETRNFRRDTNWCANNWVYDHCWSIRQGGMARYALKTSQEIIDIGGMTGWQVRAGATLPITLNLTKLLPLVAPDPIKPVTEGPERSEKGFGRSVARERLAGAKSAPRRP